MLISYEAARTLLPKVGDVRMEIPTIYKTSSNISTVIDKPEECTVVDVNAAHLWYRVKFKETGWCECYKVPRQKEGPKGGVRT